MRNKYEGTSQVPLQATLRAKRCKQGKFYYLTDSRCGLQLTWRDPSNMDPETDVKVLGKGGVKNYVYVWGESTWYEAGDDNKRVRVRSRALRTALHDLIHSDEYCKPYSSTVRQLKRASDREEVRA